MSGPSWLTTGGLAAISVLAVAAFFQAVYMVWFRPSWNTTDAGLLLTRLGNQKTPARRKQFLEQVKAAAAKSRVKGTRLPLDVANLVVAGDGNWPLLAAQMQRYAGSQDGGAQRWLAFFVKAAPLLGLAGTLVGVSEGLASYAADPSSTNRIIEAFAFAILTTLWGVGIAVLGMATSRLMWQPYLEQIFHALEQQVMSFPVGTTRPGTELTHHATRPVVRSTRRRPRPDQLDRPDGDDRGGPDAAAADDAAAIDETHRTPQDAIVCR
jgi:biopolymer transport protein ExbB/TolQ